VRQTKRTLERVTEVYHMQVIGLRRDQIIKLAREKHGWDVSPRTIDTYIALAKERFEEEAKVRRGAEIGKAIARYETIYAKAMARHELNAAIRAENGIVDLLDLRAPREGDSSDVDAFLDRLLGR
jgi:hypothetical protein